MYRADEKKAFEDMLAEISDSDEEYNGKVTHQPPKTITKPVAENKRSNSVNGTSGMAAANVQKRMSKMSKEEEEIDKFGNDVERSETQAQSEQIAITKRWLTRPCSANDRDSMKCYVERERAGFGMQTTYRCYLEVSGSASTTSGRRSSAAPEGRFLMSAKKRVVNKTSYYLISLDPNASDDRGSEHVLGKVKLLNFMKYCLVTKWIILYTKVRGNTIGSKYLITDHGLAPEKTVAPSMLRKVTCIMSKYFVTLLKHIFAGTWGY